MINDVARKILKETLANLDNNLDRERKFEKTQADSLDRIRAEIVRMESEKAAIQEVLDAG